MRVVSKQAFAAWPMIIILEQRIRKYASRGPNGRYRERWGKSEIRDGYATMIPNNNNSSHDEMMNR